MIEEIAHSDATPTAIDMNAEGVIRHAYLTVKCLKCGSKYAQADVDVYLGLYTAEDGDMGGYVVSFFDQDSQSLETHLLVCSSVAFEELDRKRCSVFGRTIAGLVFAFPCLRYRAVDGKWYSSPDAEGTHLAVRDPA